MIANKKFRQKFAEQLKLFYATGDAPGAHALDYLWDTDTPTCEGLQLMFSMKVKRPTVSLLDKLKDKFMKIYCATVNAVHDDQLSSLRLIDSTFEMFSMDDETFVAVVRYTLAHSHPRAREMVAHGPMGWLLNRYTNQHPVDLHFGRMLKLKNIRALGDFANGVYAMIKTTEIAVDEFLSGTRGQTKLAHCLWNMSKINAGTSAQVDGHDLLCVIDVDPPYLAIEDSLIGLMIDRVIEKVKEYAATADNIEHAALVISRMMIHGLPCLVLCRRALLWKHPNAKQLLTHDVDVYNIFD